MNTTGHYPARFHLLGACFLGIMLPWQTATADVDIKREALARIAHEIDALASLIHEAESQSVPDARIRFRYDWLRQDLDRIRLGVLEHLDAPRAQPRSFPPLRGDYRR